MSNVYRNCTIGEISNYALGKKIKLSGWVSRKRDHGGLIFIDLRDFYGTIQTVFDESIFNEQINNISSISIESVITVSGMLFKRSEENINSEIKNGDLEVVIDSFVVESLSSVLPFQLSNDLNFSEDIRLKYRFLDLRREKIKNNIILRSNVIYEMRKFMIENGFFEFQTPILTASSPEGARDYLVPSRIHQGKFYALPQAPQIFKQLLMVAGFDKYFQVAPCFRDEDARADRSPGEFYQLDIEMSFVTEEDVFAITENLLLHIFNKFSDKKINKKFKRIKYSQSILQYGTDKPDLRNPIIITDVTDVFVDSEFSIFKNNIAKGYVVRAIPAPGSGTFSRNFFDKHIENAKQNLKASGLAYINFISGEAKGPIAKFISQEKIEKLKDLNNLGDNDTLFFISEPEKQAATISGELRRMLGEELNLIDHSKIEFCWITDFPFFEYNQITKSLDFSHNPFSMPQGGIEALQNNDPLSILAHQYDVVCNGIELSSGAIRNHKLEILFKAFSMVGYSQEKVEYMFGSLVNAFKFGPPPHGGLAPGIDRILMILTSESNIREVICFPMNQRCEDLLMNAPSYVDEKQLKELNIQHIKKL